MDRSNTVELVTAFQRLMETAETFANHAPRQSDLTLSERPFSTQSACSAGAVCLSSIERHERAEFTTET